MPPAGAAGPRGGVDGAALARLRRADAAAAGERDHSGRRARDHAVSGVSFVRHEGGVAVTGLGRTVGVIGVLLLLPALGRADDAQRNFAGSIQLDYLAVPTDNVGRKNAFDGATLELSMKMTVDFHRDVSAQIKICYACHGFEVAMAFFDLRVADELSFRVGRFIPSFGEFPLRHDVANHRTSDKPLPYDMGRMLRLREWNMGVLPSPWVDNGVEISGSHFLGGLSQIFYAVYGI